MSETEGDDSWTIAAIAVLAALVAAAAHEAAGHGGACVALGGRITQLTSVYFQCSARSAWIPAGGPIGNIAACALALIGLRWVAQRAVGARLFCVLLAMFSWCWFAGYFVYAAVTNDGDPLFVARDVFGETGAVTRIGFAILGVALYGAGGWLMRRLLAPFGPPSRAMRISRIAWAAATLSSVAAALFYAPDRFSAATQAALEVGAASWLLLTRVGALTNEGAAPTIARRSAWLLSSGMAFALFVATLGRGLPW